MTLGQPPAAARRWGTSFRVLLAALALLFGAVSATTDITGAAPASPTVREATPRGEAFAAKTTTTIDFPTGIEFDGTFDVANLDRIEAVDLLYQAGDDPGWNLVVVPASAVSIVSPGHVTAKVTVDLQSAAIPTGITLTYAWQVTTSDDRDARSSVATVEWSDNRYDWTLVTGGAIRLHAFGLEAAFAQQILASARSTVTQLEKPYGVPRSRMIDIWVYPDSTSFRGSLPTNTRDTVAGGSFVGFSLIVAVIPNGSTSEIQRIIPHEISHQMLYQATRNPYTVLPVWFDEGMATHIQVGGTSTYLGMVISAHHNDALFNLSSLAAAFPYDASQATLAYAASWSAVLYIEETYGTRGIERLIAAFKTGDPVDAVISSALGISMEQFNANWEAWIGTLSAAS